MSIYTDPSTWRLKTLGTETADPIPYKLVEGYPKGSFEEDHATVQEQYIIRASDLANFALESFPLPTVTPSGILFVTPTRLCPGSDALGLELRTVKLDWQMLEPGKPGDPFLSDPDAESADEDAIELMMDTYAQFISVTITYEESNTDEWLMEISSNTSAEFLMIKPAAGARWQTGSGSTPPTDEASKNKDLNVPVSRILPQTEWTVKWPKIPRAFLPTIVASMRSCIGKVNSTPVARLQNAPVQTVLFLGWSYRDVFTWRVRDTPMVELELKFLERCLVIDDRMVTHNHFYRSQKGRWERLWLPEIDASGAVTGLNPVYDEADLNGIFADRA